MKLGWRAGILVCTLLGAAVTVSAVNPGVRLIGIGFIPGSALDLSGLAGEKICQRDDGSVCIDQATFGGLGSALTYTGHDGVFLATPDRGPFDGRTDVPYANRFHFLHLTTALGKPFPNIQPVLLDTRFLTSDGKNALVGDAYAFDTANPAKTRRFDPEGVAVGGDGTFFVSDEYGPYISRFDRQGHLKQRIAVPAKFLLDPVTGHPSGDLDMSPSPVSFELYPSFNVVGRQANRGMEGLAITPDGRTLVGIMQNALLQDNGINPATRARVGFNNRILTIDLESGETHEYVYVMDVITGGAGVNEILAINNHEFLVLERDNRTLVPTPPNGAAAPQLKRIYKIDLDKQGLTDVSGVASLPAGALGSIVPVTKTLVIDLLDASYKVSLTQTVKDIIAEKIEGLAWGPDLPDGRHVLYVISDNDLFPGLPTQIFSFAIDGAAAGIAYQPQEVHGPMYPPGQVKKALNDR